MPKNAIHLSVDTEREIISVGDLEIDTATLVAIADPNARVLWAFVREQNGSGIRAVPYDENEVIWLDKNGSYRGE